MIEDQEYSPLRPLVDWLDYNGYTMVTKPTKEFTDATGRRKIKGNMDIELAIDVMEMAQHLDHIVLFSGDGDFRRLVEAVQRKGRARHRGLDHPLLAADGGRRAAPPGRQVPRAAGIGAQHHARPSSRRQPAPNPGPRQLRHAVSAPAGAAGPPHDCPLCPRLARFRGAQRNAFPDWHNAPVPSFGGADGRLLIVGLAPGLRGANRTGRPFTGDMPAILLYETLRKFGFAARPLRRARR